jgi:hypothetical protein
MKAGLAASAAFLLLPAGEAFACGFQRSADAAALQLAQASDAARPARGPQSESSVSTNAPPASTTTTTGATNQPPAVKQMNEEERQKTEKEGK